VSRPVGRVGCRVAATTTAAKDGDDYVINGGKMWTTNGTQADWICLLANTSEGNPHRNKYAHRHADEDERRGDRPQAAQGRDELGPTLRRSTSTIARAPRRYRIGEEGMGFSYQMMQFQEERLFAGAKSVGIERVLKLTIDYLRERKAFGKPLLDNQYIHYKIAELQTEIEAVRVPWSTAPPSSTSQGNDVTKLASMAQAQGRADVPPRSPTGASSSGAAWATWRRPPSTAPGATPGSDRSAAGRTRS
jgi:citronellyl-CoA dehydrogenase